MPSCEQQSSGSFPEPDLMEMVRISSFSHQQSSQSSKGMAAVGSRETDFHLTRDHLDHLNWGGMGASLRLILPGDIWWMNKGGQTDTESGHQTETPSTYTNPFILSIISPAMDQTDWTLDQTGQSLDQENEQAFSDWLSDVEEDVEDDVGSIDWSISGEDDSSNDEQESENEANDLWDSFFDHDPYNPMNFSASTGHQSLGQNKKAAEEKNDDSNQFETEASENEKINPSVYQSTDHLNPLNFSVCTVTIGSTDNRKDGVRSIELSEEVTADSPGPKHLTHLCEGENCSTSTVKQEASQLEGKTIRKVRFSPVVTVHPMIVWDFAYRAARKGPWEQHARDRCRFQRRITEAEGVIASCLEQDHRNAVWAKLSAPSTELCERINQEESTKDKH
ncbi:protein phosphatase 1 regulatory subunit 15B-like [Carcharodon carcharias]|uniref:protein phosphatase 1 regulatory subunit 15B-like n=1 Tax=Carcharodon carcharias TaxID=13397 RepID=UPI001B7DAE1A|nr:protein phosphatase 1 regulatory subunit 15B-like [Carcharodon carcharias]